MRELTGHKVNPANDQIRIEVMDEPGQGGACHAYLLSYPNPQGAKLPPRSLHISFQNGPIAEIGVNGVTHEALIEILIDRLKGFQAGPYACVENADTLGKLISAQAFLHARTKARMERGVEGTHAV